MNWSLDIQIPVSEKPLEHGDKVVLLGSCFSDNLAPYFIGFGFECLSNPMGTIFHPNALAYLLEEVLNPSEKSRAFQRDDLWFDWRAASSVFGYSKDEVETKFDQALSDLAVALQSSKLLMITFGTAWGYETENIGLVANCHKMPASLFEKRLFTSEEIVARWEPILEALKKMNPKLHVVFTVSPARHSKDGLVENNRSKSRLIEAIARLESQGSGYFPSYELVIDVLRDHRFFESDLIHPNRQAIDFVWNHLSSHLFSQETRVLGERVQRVHLGKVHRVLHENSKANRQFQEFLREEEAALKQRAPQIFWK